ncbi:hypothetical protein D3C84_622840 [compost metagenome]
MFHADFGGVLHLLDTAAQHFAQGAGSHGAGHADFTLAADFGAGNRGVFLVQNADGGCGEQEAHHTVFIGAGDKAHVVMQDGRDDPRCTVSGRGHHAPAVGVFFVDGQGVQVHPVQHGQRVAQRGLRVLAQLPVQRRRAPLDLQATGQNTFVATTGVDAVLHHLPDFQQAGAGFRFRAPGAFVGQHHLADGQTVGAAMTQQVLGAFEREGQGRGVFDDAVGAGGVFVDHKATAHRVVLAAADLQAGGIKGAKDHAIGVIGQRLADHRQVEFFIEFDRVLTEQVQASGAADIVQAGGYVLGVHGVRVFTFQAQQYRLVAAVAFAGGAERAVELDFDAGGVLEQVLPTQAFDKACRGAHRANRVGAGGADANLEQVEHA